MSEQEIQESAMDIMIKEAKEIGLELTEELVQKLLPVLVKFVKAKIIESENKVDDFLLPFLPMMASKADEIAEDISDK